ncbi:MAG: bifunctional DNA primase/polymerase [Nanoarchaeota archaeon]
MIPKQLQNSEFRFVLLKPKDKKAFEKNWQKKGYKFNSKKLKEHLENGGNYGVIGGYGNLRIIDCDDKEFAKAIIDKIDTFTVETGGGGSHLYILSNYDQNHVFKNELGELRANNYQVVGANCIHPNGKKYKVIKDKLLLHISKKGVEKLIEPYLKPDISSSESVDVPKIKDETRSGKEFREVISLIRKGLNKEQVFQEMQTFAKWSSAHPTYREMTYNKALSLLKPKKSTFDVTKTPFILNPDLVFEPKCFTFDELPNGRLAVGFLLPKWFEQTNKKGEILKRTQIFSPALITDNKKLINVKNPSTLESLKVIYRALPSELKNSWGLNNIRTFLEGREKIIDKEQLFEKVKERYEFYMYYANPCWYDVNALWDMGTYFFNLFYYYPISEKRGLTGTAKTKDMEISRNMTFNPSEIMVNPSESSLFRDTNDKRYTKYLDEAEKLFRFTKWGVEADNRVELINSSYKRGSAIPRVEGGRGNYHTVYFQTYSPTMVGSINGLYGATEDRAIIHIMTRNPDDDGRGEKEVNSQDPVWGEIRNELYLFMFQNWKEIKQLYFKLMGEKVDGLKKRQFQIWLPLLTLAKYIDENLYQEVVKFAIQQSKIKSQNFITEGSMQYRICEKIKMLLENNKTDILIKEVKEAFASDEKKPSSKSIGSTFDRLGFRDFKEHFPEGNGWKLNQDDFKKIIITIIPTLYSSESSEASKDKNLDSTPKITEETVKNNEE